MVTNGVCVCVCVCASACDYFIIVPHRESLFFSFNYPKCDKFIDEARTSGTIHIN